MATLRFERPLRIRFAHCDPAGIVFFPQYLVMFNGLVEDWITEGLGIPYAGLLGPRRMGLPIVDLKCAFSAISRMGDEVVLGLQVERVGRSSLALVLDVTGPGADGGRELRVRSQQTLVCTSLDTHRPVPLPDDLRAALAAYSNNADESTGD